MLQLNRTKAQAISAQNKNPHLLSRGGYRKLEEKILTEKEESRPPPSEDDFPAPPSPPSCHQKWKLARLRSSGTYTSETAREISEKIVRVNFTLNNNIILYRFYFNFLLLYCRTPWLSRVPKVLSFQKVVMTFLLL